MVFDAGIAAAEKCPQKRAEKCCFCRQLKSFDPLFYRFGDFSYIRFFPSDLEKVQDSTPHQTMGSIYFK